jgi:hypothetical protein
MSPAVPHQGGARSSTIASAAPGDGHGDGQPAQPDDAQRMDGDDGREHQRRGGDENRCAHHPRRAQDKEIEHQNVPGRREAAEPQVVGLHPRVGEIERRGDRHHEADPERRRGRHEVRAPQRHDGHQHVGQKVDHQVEHDAVDGGGGLIHLGGARQRPVDPVDEQREPQPRK